MIALDTTTDWGGVLITCNQCESLIDTTWSAGVLCTECLKEELIQEKLCDEIIANNRKNWAFQYCKVLYAGIAKERPEPRARAPPHMRR